VPETDAPPTPTPTPPPTFTQRWGNLFITVGLLAVTVAVVVGVVHRGNPASLDIDGKPIVNADAVIADATSAFDRMVAEDGAHPPAGAGCWFAPAVAGNAAATDRPRVACGPVRLGVSRGDQVWVVGPATFAPDAGGDGWTGRFGGLRSVEAVNADELVRPDGAVPPAATDLVPPDEALRDQDGRRIRDEAAVLTRVEDSLRPAAAGSRASIAGDAGCWFGTDPQPDNPHRSDGALWCGPVRLARSGPAEAWVRVPLSIQRGEVFTTAKAQANPLTGISGTRALPATVRLYRPDGRTPPDPAQLAPPDPNTSGTGIIELVRQVPPDLVLTPPAGDARLVIPTRTLTIDGLARVPRVGTGRTAIAAAPGEELVVARFRRTDPPRSPGTKGTAQLVVGSRRASFAEWSNLPESGLLVVSVPVGADPGLEVTFDGVPQTISLATGQRSGTPRPALYRSSTDDVAVNRPVDVTAPLPGGPPARYTATVASAGVDGWRERLGWAPPGKAFVALTLKDVKVDEPCCTFTGVEAVPRWTLTLPDGTVIASTPAPDTRPAPTTVVFEAPDTVTRGELRLGLDVTWAQKGTPGTASGGPVSLPLELSR
jgi:hypothetical protein